MSVGLSKALVIGAQSFYMLTPRRHVLTYRPFAYSRTNFCISGAEGAILFAPDGAVTEDLTNLSQLRQYMSENIESWYRYANGPRGRELANGDLRLVVGYDKTTAWGMAVSAKPSQGKDTATQLRFKSAGHSDGAPHIKTHGWELYSGTAEARSGPDVREIQALSAGDLDHASNPRPYENQCIFVRTMNLTLNNAEWLKLMAGVQVQDDSGSHTSLQSGSARRHSTQGVGSSRDLGGSTDNCAENNSSVSIDKTDNRVTRRDLAEGQVYVVRRLSFTNCSPHC